jgi:transcriptional regulator with XRE-family HTH domain
MENLTPVYDAADLGAAIKQRRRELALTQVVAANLSGVSQRLWSECEQGRRANIGVETLLRILHTIGLDMGLTVRTHASVNTSGAPNG